VKVVQRQWQHSGPAVMTTMMADKRLTNGLELHVPEWQLAMLLVTW